MARICVANIPTVLLEETTNLMQLVSHGNTVGPRLLHYADIEGGYDNPERIGRLAGLIRRLDGPDAIIAGAGDNSAPGVLAMVTEGQQAVDFFEAIEADVETLGNHDFDFGLDATRSLVANAPQTFVCANTYLGEDRFGQSVGIVPWTVIDTSVGDVGVIGVTDPATDSINPKAGALSFKDPIEAVRESLPSLRSRGVEYIVVLSHLGRGDDELAESVNVDAILGGHVHSPRYEEIAGTIVTRPGATGTAIYEIDLDSRTATRHTVTNSSVDSSVVSSLRERERAAGLDEVVCRVEEPIERDETRVFGGECRIGNLVANAYRWATGADVSLQNSGGIRNGPALHGPVTVADLVSVIPFEESVVVASLSGTELRAVFSEMDGTRVDFGEQDWWHGHISGAEISFDEDRTLLSASVNGEPLDPNEWYTLATSEYLLYSNHEFPTLDQHHQVEEFDTQYDVLVEYVTTEGIETRVDGRIEVPE